MHLRLLRDVEWEFGIIKAPNGLEGLVGPPDNDTLIMEFFVFVNLRILKIVGWFSFIRPKLMNIVVLVFGIIIAD